MKTFVVSYISLFDNELKITKVTADSWFDAVVSAFHEFCGSEDVWVSTLSRTDEEAFKQSFLDCDSSIAWLEI